MHLQLRHATTPQRPHPQHFFFDALIGFLRCQSKTLTFGSIFFYSYIFRRGNKILG